MNKGIYILIVFLIWSCSIWAQENQTVDSVRISKTYSLDEIVVTGRFKEMDIRHLPMTVTVINRQQIEKGNSQSLLPILTEQVPGFFSTSRGVLGYGVSSGAAGGMSLRGVGGTPTAGLLVLIDGHPQYMGLMGHPIADAYQSVLAEKVEVLRGPASVLYGSNAMGGVINIVTRKQDEDAVKNNLQVSYGSYNTLMSEYSNRFRKGKFSSIVAASYNRTDGHRENMEFEQYTGYAKIGYDFNKKWRLFTDVNITHFNASNPGSMTVPISDNDSRITRGMTSFSLEDTYENTSGAMKFFYNWGRHKINDGFRDGEQPLDTRFNSKDRMLGVALFQNFKLYEGNRTTVGVDYQHFGGEAWNHFVTDGHEEGLSDKTENETAAYVNFSQDLGRYLTMNVGLRFNYHSHTGVEWIPQIGLSAQLGFDSNLKAIVSKGFRNPTIRELYMFVPANSELLSERLWNYELSYSQYLFNRNFHYGLNIYFLKGDNMIQTIPIEGKPLNVNTGEIENWGIEVNGSYRVDPQWQFLANYSWLNMRYPVVAAPEHKLYLGVDFSIQKWQLSTGMQYIKGLYTNTKPIVKESFLLWNMQANFQFHKIASIFVKGENLLAQKYEINLGYPMPKATIITGLNLNF